MKRWMIVAVMMLLCCGGCGSTGAFAGGAATGAALTNTFAGAKADLNAKQQALLTEQAEIVAKLEASNDDAEKAMLEAQNAALKKKLELVQTGQEGLEVVEKGISTDWTNPKETTPWALSGGSLLLAYFLNKKRMSLAQLLQALSEGVEKYKAQAQPAEAQKLYEDIKERKVVNKVP